MVRVQLAGWATDETLPPLATNSPLQYAWHIFGTGTTILLQSLVSVPVTPPPKSVQIAPSELASCVPRLKGIVRRVICLDGPAHGAPKP